MEDERMSTWIKVARYHLLKRFTYLALPWAWTAFGFAVDLLIFGLIPVSHSDHRVMTANGLLQVQNPPSSREAGGLAAIVIVYFILGVVSIAQELPFALAMGVSRRSYYTGTALLGVALAIVNGLVITVFQAVERATGGWGESVHIFQVPHVLQGPWYLTWLTSSVALALLFGWGMWSGIVYRRWDLPGALAFTAAQVTVVLAAALAITWSHAWASVGHFFTVLSAAALTGLLAALAAALLAGGYATIRRATA
jgi:hypothetical protein